MNETLHAVRFAHETGMIYSEPLPRARAARLMERLTALGMEAKLLEAGDDSDTQAHFTRAQWDDRCVLVVPGIGTIALVRVPIDIVLPEPATIGALAAAAGEDDYAEDQVVEMTPAGRALAGLSPDNIRPASDRMPQPAASIEHDLLLGLPQERRTNVVTLWLAWTIYVMAEAFWTAEGVVTSWFFAPSAPKRPAGRS